jgi:hypothetical protein
MARGHKTGGRQKGSRNKLTREIKEAALEFSGEALSRIVSIMRGEDDRVAFAAAQEVLNRAHGKPTQHTEATVEHRSVMRMPEPAKDAAEWISTSSGSHSPAPKPH